MTLLHADVMALFAHRSKPTMTREPGVILSLSPPSGLTCILDDMESSKWLPASCCRSGGSIGFNADERRLRLTCKPILTFLRKPLLRLPRLVLQECSRHQSQAECLDHW